RVPHGIAEIHQTAFGEQDDALAIGKCDLVDLRLDVGPVQVTQGRDLNLVVEVPDVGDDGPVLHGPHVIEGYDVPVAGGRDKDIGPRGRIFHGGHLVAFHGRLQGANRIDFRDENATTGLAQRGGGAFAHVTVTRDHGDLAGHHDVGAAPDPVD